MASLPTSEEETYISQKVSRNFGCIEELDEKINGVAEGWKTRRMSKVDLTIIRLALYEILHDEEVPEKVAINLDDASAPDNSSVTITNSLTEQFSHTLSLKACPFAGSASV